MYVHWLSSNLWLYSSSLDLCPPSWSPGIYLYRQCSFNGCPLSPGNTQWMYKCKLCTWTWWWCRSSCQNCWHDKITFKWWHKQGSGRPVTAISKTDRIGKCNEIVSTNFELKRRLSTISGAKMQCMWYRCRQNNGIEKTRFGPAGCTFSTQISIVLTKKKTSIITANCCCIFHGETKMQTYVTNHACHIKHYMKWLVTWRV